MPRHVASYVLVAGVALSLTAGANAQSRDTLETKLTADGATILLEWSKKHPWHQELQSRGATLIAEYRTASRGIVSEVVSAGARRERDDDDRALRFQLPEGITSPPLGSICLYVQLPTRRLLPIRRANDGDHDTARFRYEAWEMSAARRATAAVLTANADLARRKLAANQQDVTTQQSIVSRGYGQTLDACQNVPTPALADAGRPFDVLPQERHRDAATQVCVMRARNGEVSKTFEVVKSPALLERLFQLLPEDVRTTDQTLVLRQRQLREFRRDWDRWFPELDRFPQPFFGNPRDHLFLQTTTGRAAQALAQGLTPAPADLPGYVGGALEAYDRCIVDGQKQLETKLDSWQALAVSSPMRNTLARQQLVAGCERDVRKLEQLKTDGEQLRQQLAREEAALASASAATPLPRKALNLNALSCRVQ